MEELFCPACRTTFGMDVLAYRAAKEKGEVFFCPRGHRLRAKGEPELRAQLEAKLDAATKRVRELEIELLGERAANQDMEDGFVESEAGCCPVCGGKTWRRLFVTGDDVVGVECGRPMALVDCDGNTLWQMDLCHRCKTIIS